MSEFSIGSRYAWSACPTPLTDSLELDVDSVKRMVDHHVRLGIQGLFAGGTSGEGVFLPRKVFRRLTSEVVQANASRMVVSVQTTDTSFSRVLENIAEAKADGADIAIVAEPLYQGFRMNPDFLMSYYLKILEKSSLPVGIYFRQVLLSMDEYRQVLMHPNVCVIKDSSCNMALMNLIMEVIKERKELAVMNGYEFGLPLYLKAGYPGVVAGAGLIIGYLVVKIIEAARNNDFDLADQLQARATGILSTIYGDSSVVSWMTGFKYTLVKIGIFNSAASYLKYPFSAEQARKVDQMIEQEKDVLFP